MHPRLRNKPNTATSGAVVQLVRIRACHARGRGFEPLPHRQVPLMKNEGHLSYIGVCGLSVNTHHFPDKTYWVLLSFLTLIMKIQSHRKTVTKNAIFYTVCHKNEKRGKIRLFFTPFVRYSAAECSLIPVIVIASGVCRLFTNDYFCRLV